MTVRVVSCLMLSIAAAAFFASCGGGGDEDDGWTDASDQIGDGDTSCDRAISPIITLAVDEVAGCVDTSPASEVIIGCRAEGDLVEAVNTCYRNLDTGQLVFSFSVYPHVDPGWVEEMSCGYSYDDACP